MIFDFLVHSSRVNIQLRLVEEALSAFPAQLDLFSVLLMHSENVGLQSVFPRRNEGAVLSVAGKLIAQVLWNVPLEVPRDSEIKVDLNCLLRAHGTLTWS